MKNIAIAVLSLALLVLVYFNYFNEAPNNSKQNTTPTIQNIEHDKSNNDIVQKLERKKNENSEPEHHHEHSSKHEDKHQIIESDHSHDLGDKKKLICANSVEDSACIVDLGKDLKSIMIDEKADSVKANSTSVILNSSNFYEALEELSTDYNTGNGYEYSRKFSAEILGITSELAGNVEMDARGLKCSDFACGAVFSYGTMVDWNEFSKSFIAKNEGLGSIILSHTGKDNVKQARLIFFPELKGQIFD